VYFDDSLDTVSFESDEYHVRTSKTIKEAEEWIEAGFEYVTQ